MKAHVLCIFVVIRGEGQSLESLWRHPTHEWYIPPVRPFFTNLQAVRLCLRLVRTLHNNKAKAILERVPQWLDDLSLFHKKVSMVLGQLLQIYESVLNTHCHTFIVRQYGKQYFI